MEYALVMPNIAILVGGDWNMTRIFPYIGKIIPIDGHIFQRV